MKKIAVTLIAIALLSGCSQHGSSSVSSWGRPSGMGTKPVDQVSPCCRELALGHITLAQCMQNPQCKANGCRCCMNAIKDMSPR